jgi:hypothetical protein
MSDPALSLVQTIRDEGHLAAFAGRLRRWLLELAEDEGEQPALSESKRPFTFTESRAKALLRAAEVIDDPTLNDFTRLLENETMQRLTLYDLLQQSGLANQEAVQALILTSSPINPDEGPETTDGTVDPTPSSVVRRPPSSSWLSLILSAFAWQKEYPLAQLDPAAPPAPFSPAGQALKRTAHLLRQQVQRTATERDKLARKLAYSAQVATNTAHTLDSLPDQPPAAPLPPYYRPPIPVRYAEVARDTVRVDEAESDQAEPPMTRADTITITGEDLNDEPQRDGPVRMPPITITEEQIRPSAPARSSSTPRPTRRRPVEGKPAPLTQFTDSVRRLFSSNEPMTTTKLRVIVETYPDGPPMYGLQVRVNCRGVRSFVAGTTNEAGHFLCSLPVPIHASLTYDVDVTWPRDMNNDKERKSITLNGDRTEFKLPFYRHHTAP